MTVGNKIVVWEEAVSAGSESGPRALRAPHALPTTTIKDKHTESGDLALESRWHSKTEERNIFLLRSRQNDLTSTVPVTQTRSRCW